jgi:acyl phosphate:glycerol-3-phosphate acyltransferase
MLKSGSIEFFILHPSSFILHLAVLIIAYLLGSIPFGYLIVKLRTGSDIRASGSGATGATNVTRKAGKTAGLATLILDLIKGSAAVLLASRLDPEMVPWAGLTAIAGHCFPVWLGFRAGKGVATALGVFLAIAPWEVLIGSLIFALTFWRTRYVSLSSIAAALTIPLALVLHHSLIHAISDFTTIITAASLSSGLIIAKHSENIRRLLTGTENKFGVAP